jgi:hypothetical protein
MSVTVEDATERVPSPTQSARGGWWSRGRIAIVVAVMAGAGLGLSLFLARSGSTPPEPSTLTWYWNAPFAQGGSSSAPVGWNITWGQGATSQRYPADDRCALVVSGAPELINVPCNGGSWHWSGQEPTAFVPSPVPGGGTGPYPKTEFLVIENGRATVFPVP